MSPKTLRLSTAVADRVFTPAFILAAVPSDPADGAESWIQLLKQGEFWDPRYGSFTVDDETFQKITENFDGMNLAVPGDYDHSFGQTGDSRAAGWVKKLQVRATELWGLVSFTPAAAAAIRAGEYRYISPEFSYDHVDETGVHVGPALLAFGLTNRPFLEGMAEVSLAADPAGNVLLSRSSHPTDQEAFVDPKKLAEALGLPADSTEEVILAKVRDLKPDAETVVLSKVEHTKLLTEAGQSKADAEAQRVLARDAVIDKAIGEEKILPAMRDVFLTAYDSDAEKTTKTLSEMKPLGLFKAVGGKGEDQNGDEDLSDAPFGDRVHALAQSYQKQDEKLDYRDAVARAYKEIDKKKAVA